MPHNPSRSGPTFDDFAEALCDMFFATTDVANQGAVGPDGEVDHDLTFSLFDEAALDSAVDRMDPAHRVQIRPLAELVKPGIERLVLAVGRHTARAGRA